MTIATPLATSARSSSEPSAETRMTSLTSGSVRTTRYWVPCAACGGPHRHLHDGPCSRRSSRATTGDPCRTPVADNTGDPGEHCMVPEALLGRPRRGAPCETEHRGVRLGAEPDDGAAALRQCSPIDLCRAVEVLARPVVEAGDGLEGGCRRGDWRGRHWNRDRGRDRRGRLRRRDIGGCRGRTGWISHVDGIGWRGDGCRLVTAGGERHGQDDHEVAAPTTTSSHATRLPDVGAAVHHEIEDVPPVWISLRRRR